MNGVESGPVDITDIHYILMLLHTVTSASVYKRKVRGACNVRAAVQYMHLIVSAHLECLAWGATLLRTRCQSLQEFEFSLYNRKADLQLLLKSWEPEEDDQVEDTDALQY